MPTKLPRVNVTVTEEQRELLFGLAELRGGSAAGMLRELLDEVTPFLRHALPRLKRASQEREASLSELEKILNLSLDEIGTAMINTQLDIEDVLRKTGGRAAADRAGSEEDAARHTASKAERK